MFTSTRFAPPRTWSSATLRRLGVVAGADEPGEPQRAGDVRALADHLEVAVGPDGKRLEARELREARPSGDSLESPREPFGSIRGGTPATAFAIAAMCSGVVPQQPPTMFTKPLVGNSREVAAGVGRLFVVLAKGVRQPRVRIAADVAVGDPRELGHVRTHVARAEGTVDADTERLRVRDRHPEGVDRLARQRASAAIGDR